MSTPSDVTAKIAAAYAMCESYIDDGTVLLADGRSGTFATHFVRPSQLSFRFDMANELAVRLIVRPEFAQARITRRRSTTQYEGCDLSDVISRVSATTRGVLHAVPRLLIRELGGRSIFDGDIVRIMNDHGSVVVEVNQPAQSGLWRIVTTRNYVTHISIFDPSQLQHPSVCIDYRVERDRAIGETVFDMLPPD